MMFWTKVKLAALAWGGAAAVGAAALAIPAPAAPKAVEDRVYATAALPAPEEPVLFLADIPQADPATGTSRVSELLGLWTLDDEKAEDASGRGAHGKVVGAVGKADGKLKGCLSFDGKGGYVELPRTSDLDRVEQGSYTLAAWFKPANLPPAANDDDNAGAYGIVVKTGWHEGLTYTREGTFLMTHWLAGKEGADPVWKGIGTWGESYEPGKWYHVAGVVNKPAGTVEIFVNGEAVKSEEFEKDAPARKSDGQNWKIGIASPGAEKWSWPANGAIDDVRIYSRALSATEVKALFEAK